MTDPTPTVQDIIAPIDAVADAPEIAAATTTPAAPAEGSVTGIELDRTRKQLAYRLLWVMIGVIAVIILVSLIYSVRCWTDGRTCAAATTALGILTGSLSPIFTAMVGLVGSVIGFYFGSKQG